MNKKLAITLSAISLSLASLTTFAAAPKPPVTIVNNTPTSLTINDVSAPAGKATSLPGVNQAAYIVKYNYKMKDGQSISLIAFSFDIMQGKVVKASIHTNPSIYGSPTFKVTLQNNSNILGVTENHQ